MQIETRADAIALTWDNAKRRLRGKHIVMAIIGFIAGFASASLLMLVCASMVLTGNWVAAALLLALAILAFPATGRSVGRALQVRFARPGAFTVLLAALVGLMIFGGPDSIYRSPEIRARFQAIYDEKMQAWPVAYDDIFLDTGYGRIHVIASGPEGAPVILLLHASGVASWTWKGNIAALAQIHRVYAIDLIGDAGKSEYSTLSNTMGSGRDQADLYATIADMPGVTKAVVVGASEGGFIATNLALYHPERVKGLILLGPMGYSGAIRIWNA